MKAAHRHYGRKRYFLGASLTSDEQRTLSEPSVPIVVPRKDTTYLYKCFGAWGLSAKPFRWHRFQTWFHSVRKSPEFRPYVPGVLPDKWYRQFEREGTADNMWEMWLIHYMVRKKLYGLYNNLPRYNGDGKSCLCINRREVGLHNTYKGREDFCELLRDWKEEYVVFPDVTVKLDWNGKAVLDY